MWEDLIGKPQLNSPAKTLFPIQPTVTGSGSQDTGTPHPGATGCQTHSCLRWDVCGEPSSVTTETTKCRGDPSVSSYPPSRGRASSPSAEAVHSHSVRCGKPCLSLTLRGWLLSRGVLHLSGPQVPHLCDEGQIQ